MRNLIICLVLSLLAVPAPAHVPEQTWMSVLLDGRKIGHMLDTRKVSGDQVITTQSMEISIERAGISISFGNEETSTETLAGKPLGFVSRSKISSIESVVRGTLRDDGQIDVTTEVGGAKQTRVMPWPKGALLAEGLRLSGVHTGLKPGTQFSDLAFQSSSLDAVEVQSLVRGSESVDLPSGRRELVRVEQDIKLPGMASHTQAWVDADQTVYKVIMPLMGFNLTMLACDKSCALAPNQSTDMLTQMLVRAPHALSKDELSHGIKITLQATDNSEPLTITQTDEQRVMDASSGRATLNIMPLLDGMPGSGEDKPIAADFQPTDWLQSTAPEIVKLAKQGIGDATAPADRMHNLQEFVRHFIRNKDLSVGYASALEVAKNPEGDCTEHAVLLAALGRASGIATRVVDGMAYTDHYAGKDNVFVPHAWAQAWIDGRWQSFDAALAGFDAGHIALSVGDGDPWRFYSGLGSLGRIRVSAITPLVAAPATP